MKKYNPIKIIWNSTEDFEGSLALPLWENIIKIIIINNNEII